MYFKKIEYYISNILVHKYIDGEIPKTPLLVIVHERVKTVQLC